MFVWISCGFAGFGQDLVQIPFISSAWRKSWVYRDGSTVCLSLTRDRCGSFCCGVTALLRRKKCNLVSLFFYSLIFPLVFPQLYYSRQASLSFCLIVSLCPSPFVEVQGQNVQLGIRTDVWLRSFFRRFSLFMNSLPRRSCQILEFQSRKTLLSIRRQSRFVFEMAPNSKKHKHRRKMLTK